MISHTTSPSWPYNSGSVHSPTFHRDVQTDFFYYFFLDSFLYAYINYNMEHKFFHTSSFTATIYWWIEGNRVEGQSRVWTRNRELNFFIMTRLLYVYCERKSSPLQELSFISRLCHTINFVCLIQTASGEWQEEFFVPLLYITLISAIKWKVLKEIIPKKIL